MSSKNTQGNLFLVLKVLASSALVTLVLVAGSEWFFKRSDLSARPEETPQNQNDSTINQPQEKVTLSALGDTFSGYSTLRSAAFQGSLLERRVELDYSDEFDQEKRALALTKGKADIIVTTLDQYLTYLPEGKIVALLDRTIGADAVVLNTKNYPKLNSLLELEKLIEQSAQQGKRLKIVFAGDTPSEFLATALDTKFTNFNLTDLDIIRVTDASEAWQEMQQDPEIAVAVLWEPFVTKAKNEGNTVVISSGDVPTTIVDVAVASNRILENDPEAVKHFVEAYYRRVDSSLQDKGVLVRQISTDSNLSSADAELVVKGIKFFTSVEAKQWMESGTLDKRINSIAAILNLSAKISSIPDNPSELYDSQYLNPIAQQTATMIDLIAADDPELVAQLKNQDKENSVKQASAKQVQDAKPIGNLQLRGEVKFETGSIQLTPTDKQTLNQLAQEINELSPQTIAVEVQGHTSQTGSQGVNQQLSEQRAKVVENYLKEQKLPHSIVSKGLGYSQLLPGLDSNSPLHQRTIIRLVRINS